MDKAQQILFHIDELYSEKPSEEKILKACELNPAKHTAWQDAFQEYDLSDVLTAIDNYWEFKNSKTKPNVAQIKAILNTHKAEKIKQSEAQAPSKELPTAYHFWKKDGETGDLKYFLSDYEHAFNLCITDYLAEIIPAEEFSRMSWQKRIRAALDNGVLNRMQEALQAVCNKPRFQSENEYNALHGKSSSSVRQQFQTNINQVLASHWRVS